MAKEAVSIIKRRFTGRILESSLLVLAVALGVGAGASGLSLLFHTNQYSARMLASPAYRELIVTTRDNIKDMERPVIEKLKTENTTLIAADLKAGEIVPQVAYAYIQSNTWMGFMTEELLTDKGVIPGSGGRRSPPPEGEKQETEDQVGEGREPGNIEDEKDNDGDNGSREGDKNRRANKEMDEEARKFFEMVETFKEARDNPDFIIPEIEGLPGYQVSPQFFNAWNIEAVEGSLFTSSDMTSKSNLVILGASAAKLLSGENIESLTGKKIISYDTYYTIIGILGETGTEYDNYFFKPDVVFNGGEKFRGRNRFMNRQLRFTVNNPSDLDSAAILLEDWFEKAYGEGQIEVSNPRAEAYKLVNRNRGISILILFLSLAALFIASVNVSNILMSRSLRMRKHVGILKALGASKVNILRLFAGEAIFITVAGSILGTIMAFPLSNAMESSLDLGSGSFWNILAGVALSAVLTLIFSIVPSWKNSGIEAAEAMRSVG